MDPPVDSDEEYPELEVQLGIPEQPQETRPADEPERKKAPAQAPALTPKQKAQAERRARLAREALSFRGAPYVWGGDGRSGFDCSGFTQYLYGRRGIELPHSARMQFDLGAPVERSELREGDLVFFNTRGPISHVGMYIGSGKFVHAANPRRGVTVSPLDSPYYTKRYAGARRYTK